MTHLDFKAEFVSGLIGIFSTRRHTVSQPSAKHLSRVPLHLSIQYTTKSGAKTAVQKELKIVPTCTAALVVATYVL